ncbi:hypothetical protein [Erythrobacter aureus]|uniref:Uncharacterized protein n=1 Tax=Erythrobacter aureus TaxID=2182384 RepID=A0A345YIS1_9SPHN|nr:hypothetical protein [Erythrobacter aureus]AXK43823.1 hypothetical protein DVR09_15315 [Erythrobacter aureus]
MSAALAMDHAIEEAFEPILLPPKPWTTEAAMALCAQIEEFAPKFGCHVALTGGTLYKPGPRKDVDILFYRIRQVDDIDRQGLMMALHGMGLEIGKRHGWVQKGTWEGKPVDLFFPDHIDHIDDETGEYA